MHSLGLSPQKLPRGFVAAHPNVRFGAVVGRPATSVAPPSSTQSLPNKMQEVGVRMPHSLNCHPAPARRVGSANLGDRPDNANGSGLVGIGKLRNPIPIVSPYAFRRDMN